MEVLRFGSSIPGGYWGCCAADIIQNCKVDPNAKASISLVDGDGGVFMNKFLGMTYKEIFLSRLRIGTFSTRDMPNHAFFVVLEKTQTQGGYGLEWLKILKENGFEFIRAVNNSVWNKDNYVFALFRNNGPNNMKDQFTPPPGWTDLPSVKPEAWEFLTVDQRVKLTADQQAVDQKIWDRIGPAKLYTQQDIEAKEVPVLLAAIRTPFPPQGPNKRAEAIGKYEKGFGSKPSSHHAGNVLDPIAPKQSNPPTAA